MAYSPSEKYPGAVDVDPDYQGGKFRDNNPSTTNNGSPLKALDRNEQLALQEAIFNAAGFNYNGIADTPQASQMFDAYKAALSNGANLISNHNFLVQSPDDSQPPPDATPRTYPPGFQIFSGVFANETTGILNLTYIDGRVSFSGGDFYMAVTNTGGVERLTEFVASVADFDGKPRTRGVSFALVGDEYRITVGVDALEDVSANPTPLGSVKFEQGSVATGHTADKSISDANKIYTKDELSSFDGSFRGFYLSKSKEITGDDLLVYEFSPSSEGLKGEISAPGGVYIPRNFHWTDMKARGIRQGGSHEASNNTIFLDMLAQSNQEGGVLDGKNLYGTYQMGEISHDWNFNSLRKEKGIVGAGVGLTNLLFNTDNNLSVFDQSELSIWFRYENFTASGTATQKGQLFGGTFGSPRSRIQGLRMTNWRRGAEWVNWVSNINRVVAEDCFEGFVVYGGTSLGLSELYALNCDFGYILGCDRNADGTYQYMGDSVYSTYKNLACDGSKEAAYVFGSNRGVNLSGGAEAVGKLLFSYPELIGAPALTKRENNNLHIDRFSAAGLNSSFPILSIDREGIRTKISGSTFSANSPLFSPGFDFNTKLGLELDNVSGQNFEIPDNCWDIKVDGRNIGNVSNFYDGTHTTVSTTTSGNNKRLSTDLTMRGDEKIQLRLTSDEALSPVVEFYSSVKISPIDNSATAGLAFGTTEINSRGSASAPVLERVSTGNLGATVTASIVSDLVNGGKYIEIQFVAPGNTSAFAYSISVDMKTNAESPAGTTNIPFITRS